MTSRARWIGLGLLCCVAGAGFVEPLSTLFRVVPRDYNEGWMGYYAGVAWRGETLYPSSTLIANNYPPVSFYLAGGVGALVGDDILAGRLLSLAGLLIVALNIARWLRVSGTAPGIAAIGAAVFTATAVTWAPWYVAMNDPQWMAHAMMTTALVMVWRRPDNATAIALSAVLMVLAGFTKHLLVPVPIAVGLWLFRRDRRTFARWATWMLTLIAVGVGAATAAYGPSFVTSLAQPRTLDMDLLIGKGLHALVVLGPMTAIALGIATAPRARMHFVRTYTIVSAIAGIAAGLGEGVDVNAFFDMLIAASLGVALAVEATTARVTPFGRLTIGAVALSLVAGYLAVRAAQDLPHQWSRAAAVARREDDAKAMIDRLRPAEPGRVACETAALCYWSGLTSSVDFFMSGQMLSAGRIPAASCRDLFSSGSVRLLQLQSPEPPFGSERLPAECNETIRRHYRTVFSSPDTGVLLVFGLTG